PPSSAPWACPSRPCAPPCASASAPSSPPTRSPRRPAVSAEPSTACAAPHLPFPPEHPFTTPPLFCHTYPIPPQGVAVMRLRLGGRGSFATMGGVGRPQEGTGRRWSGSG